MGSLKFRAYRRHNKLSPGRLILFFIFIFALLGYGHNIYLLCKTDFKAPYKAEFIRTAGTIIPPIGAITGYTTIKD